MAVWNVGGGLVCGGAFGAKGPVQAVGDVRVGAAGTGFLSCPGRAGAPARCPAGSCCLSSLERENQ